jgi:hypothetical protein
MLGRKCLGNLGNGLAGLKHALFGERRTGKMNIWGKGDGKFSEEEEGARRLQSSIVVRDANQRFAGIYIYIVIIFGLAQDVQLGRRAGARHVWDLLPSGR